MKNRVIAIIPARGGSRGIPRKNILNFLGKPLLAHSIEAGLETKPITDVVVSTEDDEIADVARKYGASILTRPIELASDTSSTFSVLRHAYRELKEPDIIVTLQPTSPLRKAHHVEQALDLLSDDVDTVVSVCETHHYRWELFDGYGIPHFDARRPRQKMVGSYVENGSIYVSRTKVFKSNDETLGMGISSSGRVNLYLMDEIHSIEIDSEQDLKILELLNSQLPLS